MTQTTTLIVPAPKVLLEALTSISQGVLVAGPDLRLTFCNQGFSTLTGYDACEIIGRSCDFLQGPGTDPTTIRAIRDALDGGRKPDAARERRDAHVRAALIVIKREELRHEL